MFTRQCHRFVRIEVVKHPDDMLYSFPEELHTRWVGLCLTEVAGKHLMKHIRAHHKDLPQQQRAILQNHLFFFIWFHAA